MNPRISCHVGGVGSILPCGGFPSDFSFIRQPSLYCRQRNNELTKTLRNETKSSIWCQTGRSRECPFDSDRTAFGLVAPRDPVDHPALRSELLRENGYAAVSLRQIANEAGIRASTIYYHFESKEEILFTSLKKGCASSCTRSRAWRPAGLSFHERLRIVVRTATLHGLLQVGDFPRQISI